MKALVLFVLVAVAQHITAQETLSQQGGTSTPSELGKQVATQPTGTSADQATKQNIASAEYRPGIGTIIVAELANSISAKKAKIGDRVECTVVSDLMYEGKIVVPRNTKVVGHVTEAQAFTKEHPESRLGLTFETIVLKNKKELLFQAPAIVVALAPPIKGSVGTTTNVRDMPIQMQKGGQGTGASTTGASIVGSITNNPNLLGGNMGSANTAIEGASRGVIGWPGLYLLRGAPGTSIIASPKTTVELGFETQMVLRVVEASK